MSYEPIVTGTGDDPRLDRIHVLNSDIRFSYRTRSVKLGARHAGMPADYRSATAQIESEIASLVKSKCAATSRWIRSTNVERVLKAK